MKTSLVDILGRENVHDTPASLEDYSCDQSFVEPKMPQYVAFPQTLKQIQEIVKIANQEKVPLIPFSSGLNLHGATIPDQGGIMLDLSKMDRILGVDQRNRWALIEPGVTYEKLQDQLADLGLRTMIPWGVPPARSVLSSQMERDPNLSCASFDYGADRILDIELVLPEGELYRTGGWGATDKPKGSFNYQHRTWTGAQGTFGVVSKLALKVERLPDDGKVFFLCFEKFEQVLAPLKAIQRREIGLECFVLNGFNLAAAVTEGWEIPKSFPMKPKKSEKFIELRKHLPNWIIIISLPAAPYFPDDKFDYEEEALRKITSEFKIELLTTLPHTEGLHDFFVKEMLRPWSILKKFNFKGSVHDLSFKTPLSKIPRFMNIVESLSKKHKYPLDEIGGYVLPMERGRACHCEFDFHCDLNNGVESSKVKRLWLEASQALIDEGAFFDRPYGVWAEMMFSRTGNYAEKLRALKRIMDPNNIMNPGKLCFAQKGLSGGN